MSKLSIQGCLYDGIKEIQKELSAKDAELSDLKLDHGAALMSIENLQEDLQRARVEIEQLKHESEEWELAGQAKDSMIKRFESLLFAPTQKDVFSILKHDGDSIVPLIEQALKENEK